MKKITMLFLIAWWANLMYAQDFSISHNNIGSFKLGMPDVAAQTQTRSPVLYKGVNSRCNVVYHGEQVILGEYEAGDYDQLEKGSRVVNFIATTSPKFKTSKNIGVGSSRAQVLAAYKGAKYQVENSKTGIMVISEADVALEFSMQNDKVKKVSIYHRSAG